MATNDEIQEQLALTQKLNRVIDQIAASTEKIEQSYASQITYLQKINAVLNQVNVGSSTKELGKLDAALKGVTDKVGSIGGTSKQNMQQLVTSAAKASEGIGKFSKNTFIAGSAMTGLWQGMKNVAATSKSLVGLLTSVADTVVSVGLAIATIPIKIFTGLVDMAAAADLGIHELLQAIENVRKAFGDLAEPSAMAIKTVNKELTGFKDTGLSAWRVFGTLAERLNYIRETAEAMGASFDILTREFETNGGAILAYQKGLGLSAEQLKAFGQRAITVNEPMSEFLRDTTKQTLAMGDAFGISQKLIGRDMGKAFEDMRHFATRSVKEISQAVVYARKLGIELDKIVGTLDAFETFDTAAENVSKLTQSFNVFCRCVPTDGGTVSS